MSSSVAQDPSSRVVTRARIGFRARVTYFELGCPETNIDPNLWYRFLPNYTTEEFLAFLPNPLVTTIWYDIK